MATPLPLQSTFIHAAVYSNLFLQMANQIFPDVAYLALTDDQRRVAQNETDNLLTRSRLRVESRLFVNTFGFQNPDQGQVAPVDAVWGAALETPKADTAKPPGQYM